MARAETRIGMVGVGRMGANIARRLKGVGFSLSAVYDLRLDVARELAAELGAELCERVGSVTGKSEVVITVVSDDVAMRNVFSETGDSLLQDARGKLFINCATVTPQVQAEVEGRAEQSGAQALVACMASSIPQARDGTLYLICGGTRDAFERATPILQAMSSSLRHVGDCKRAAQIKALVNMVMNINTAGLAEGLGLGAALGIDLDLLRDVFAQTGAHSRVLETDGRDMQDREHECYFSAAHAAKDSGIAVQLGVDAGLTLPLARATMRQYERMIELGKGELDKSGVSELTFPGRR